MPCLAVTRKSVGANGGAVAAAGLVLDVAMVDDVVVPALIQPEKWKTGISYCTIVSSRRIARNQFQTHPERSSYKLVASQLEMYSTVSG